MNQQPRYADIMEDGTIRTFSNYAAWNKAGFGGVRASLAPIGTEAVPAGMLWVSEEDQRQDPDGALLRLLFASYSIITE